MPLKKSKSQQAFDFNVKAEMDAGKPQDQALAIAYDVKRRAKRKKLAKGGKVEAPEGYKGRTHYFDTHEGPEGLVNPKAKRGEKKDRDLQQTSLMRKELMARKMATPEESHEAPEGLSLSDVPAPKFQPRPRKLAEGGKLQPINLDDPNLKEGHNAGPKTHEEMLRQSADEARRFKEGVKRGVIDTRAPSQTWIDQHEEYTGKSLLPDSPATPEEIKEYDRVEAQKKAEGGEIKPKAPHLKLIQGGKKTIYPDRHKAAMEEYRVRAALNEHEYEQGLRPHPEVTEDQIKAIHAKHRLDIKGEYAEGGTVRSAKHSLEAYKREIEHAKKQERISRDSGHSKRQGELLRPEQEEALAKKHKLPYVRKFVSEDIQMADGGTVKPKLQPKKAPRMVESSIIKPKFIEDELESPELNDRNMMQEDEDVKMYAEGTQGAPVQKKGPSFPTKQQGDAVNKGMRGGSSLLESFKSGIGLGDKPYPKMKSYAEGGGVHPRLSKEAAKIIEDRNARGRVNPSVGSPVKGVNKQAGKDVLGRARPEGQSVAGASLEHSPSLSMLEHKKVLKEMRSMPKPKIQGLAEGGEAKLPTLIKGQQQSRLAEPYKGYKPHEKEEADIIDAKKHFARAEARRMRIENQRNIKAGEKGARHPLLSPAQSDYINKKHKLTDPDDMYAEGGEVEEHSSIADAIMHRKRLQEHPDDVYLMDSEVDIDDNAREMPNEYYQLNEGQALKENYDEDMMHVDQPMDSNEHDVELDSDEHDRVSQIMRKRKMRG